MSTTMGTAIAGPAGPAGPAGRRDSTARRSPRRPRTSTLVIAAGVLLALAVVILVGGRGPTTSDPLDPDNPSPPGAQALARVLADRGVEVEVARSADALEATGVDDRTTVLVTGSVLLGPGTAERLLDHASPAEVVVTDPSPGLLDLLDVDVEARSAQPGGPVTAACRGAGSPDLAGLELEVDLALAYPTDEGCFRHEDGWLLARPRPGLSLLGAGDVLANDQVLRGDNAAVALRVLGRAERLVWYVPDPADLGADDGVALRTLLPDAVLPALWLLGVAAVVGIWWRARRLGPLAVEPLPVAVRAVETAESRGRLYRRAGDRAHAASALRAAARDEVARSLRLGRDLRGSDPRAVVAECARRTLLPPAEVEALLRTDAPPPPDDAALVRLARDLDDLTARLAPTTADRRTSHDDR